MIFFITYIQEYTRTGDSDTLACITGAIAEAFYREIPTWMLKGARRRIDDSLWSVLVNFCRRTPYFLKLNHDYSRVTPRMVKQLDKNEIFVFGSNLEGRHAGGAAYTATKLFGAVWGVGVGPTGQTYAIPTMHGGVDDIRPYVDQFVEYAAMHSELKFFVTRIGCGIAGFDDEDIAPLFIRCKDMENVWLPDSFWFVLEEMGLL